jgi:hypothetical protein
MKALTIQSPWAQHIMRDGKDVENRIWATRYRGPLLIHVSLKPETPESGLIIGVVDVVDCLPPGNLITAGNPWAFPECYHWILRNPREFRVKIPAKGNLGLWTFDIDPAALKKVF